MTIGWKGDVQTDPFYPHPPPSKGHSMCIHGEEGRGDLNLGM